MKDGETAQPPASGLSGSTLSSGLTFGSSGGFKFSGTGFSFGMPKTTESSPSVTLSFVAPSGNNNSGSVDPVSKPASASGFIFGNPPVNVNETNKDSTQSPATGFQFGSFGAGNKENRNDSLPTTFVKPIFGGDAIQKSAPSATFTFGDKSSEHVPAAFVFKGI